MTVTASFFWLRSLTSISSFIVLRVVSTLKSSWRRSPTTSNAEPSLISMFSFFGVWSMTFSPMNSSVLSALSNLLTRMRPDGSGMPMLCSVAFLKPR